MYRSLVSLAVVMLLIGPGSAASEPRISTFTPELPDHPASPIEALDLALRLNGIDSGVAIHAPTTTVTTTTTVTMTTTTGAHGAYEALLSALGLPPSGAAPLPGEGTAIEPILADMLVALTQAVTLQRAAWDALTPADHDQMHALDAAYRASRDAGDRAVLERAVDVHGGLPPSFDRGLVATAAHILVEAGLRAAAAVDAVPAADWPHIQAALPGCATDPLGVVAVCGPGDDVLSGTFVLELDLGGNDVHATNAGSAGLGVLFPGPSGLPGALAVDVAGHDTYTGGAQVQGTGSSAPGVLIDVDGHDQYRSTAGFFTFAQGAGHLGGVGILYDAFGDDTYVGAGSPWDTQGFGILGGTGILVDAAGYDGYAGGTYAQGAGDFNAVGLLVDGSGADVYAAGTRTQGFGDGAGLGGLWDGEGNDRYGAGHEAQGAGVGGTGILVDDLGNDVYTAGSTAQGWAIEGPTLGLLLGLDVPGTGLLVDGAGTDSYSGAGCDLCVWTGGAGGLGVDTL